MIEGFGLVPFEAAAHGAPCLWAPGSSLSELLPDGDAGIVPWDAERSAERALALIRDDGARERNLEAIRRGRRTADLGRDRRRARRALRGHGRRAGATASALASRRRG